VPLRQPEVSQDDALAQALTMVDPKHLNWSAEALWRALDPLLPGISVEVHSRIESTNTRLLDRARALSGQPDAPVTRPGELDALSRREVTPHGRRAGDISPCLLVAEQQTRGRGRLGRGWISSAGASLTFSVSLPLEPAQWSGLSLAVGLAIADALDPLPLALQGQDQPRIGLKWPNDLWLMEGPGQGRKLGGILIETVTVGDRRMCVVGLGLNIRPQSAEGVAHGYACLQEIDAQASAPAALTRVAEPLVRALKRFEREGFEPLVAAYSRRDLLLGQAVSISQPQALEGIAEGVDEQGALRVRSDGVHRVVSGEVSVRLGTASAGG
jgi:BirA family biotin operon repressor/biotin-[acetyl-CoA-carboxylase] ligase